MTGLQTFLQPRLVRATAVVLWSALITIPAIMAFRQWGYTIGPENNFQMTAVGFILGTLWLAAVAGPIILIYLLPRARPLGPPNRGRLAAPPSEILPEVPEHLVTACKSGECVLYAGAGLSAQARLPTWNRLVPRLLEWAIDQGLIREDAKPYLRAACQDEEFDSVADAIVAVAPPDLLHAELVRIFSKASLPEAHRILRRLPFAAVLTTNFDDLLERAFSQTLFERLGNVLTPSPQQPTQVQTHADTEALLTALSHSSFFILKLYGPLERPDTVLLAPVQYEGKVARNHQFAQFME